MQSHERPGHPWRCRVGPRDRGPAASDALHGRVGMCHVQPGADDAQGAVGVNRIGRWVRDGGVAPDLLNPHVPGADAVGRSEAPGDGAAGAWVVSIPAIRSTGRTGARGHRRPA